MLVDNPMSTPFVSAPYTLDYNQELNDIFHTELFTLPSSGASQSSSSRESTPNLLTPPQMPPAGAFPDINDPHADPASPLFSFLDEDFKALDPLALLTSHPYDLFSPFAAAGGGGGSASTSTPSTSSVTEADITSFLGGIDPQLVDSPAPVPLDDFESPPSQAASVSSPEELLIAPVKVGGHGKARKGTVVGGGVKKASATPALINKENSHTSTPVFSTAASSFKPRSTAKAAAADDDEDDDGDDVPADWRPPPEVFAKMTSKEKRQLRNKISARNFRVRRKEYISTLEDNIAERDRLLDAIRSELGSTQSENLALRQEIAALKRTLLENRGPAPVLPPPAPLPASPTLSTAATPAAASSSTGLPPLNTHKDVGMTNKRFWGGSPSQLGGGYTSVHTARIPELLGTNPFAASPFAGALETPTRTQQENLNPALNGGKVAEVVRSGLGLGAATGAPNAGVNGDAFGDAHPFTMRSLDAYRMHLWGRMAAQYQYNKEHGAKNPSPSGSSSASSPSSVFSSPSPFAKTHSPPQSPPMPFTSQSLSGLASGLRPKYFANPGMGVNGLVGSFDRMSLGGKGAAASTSGSWRGKEKEKEVPAATQKEREAAMYAALASQTLVKRLGSAFWDAFSGNDRSSAVGGSSSHAHGHGKWDTEKVRKVLEGTAVVKVVDVEPAAKVSPPPKTPVPAKTPAPETPAAPRCPSHLLTEVLEESMRSLSLGKKQ